MLSNISYPISINNHIQISDVNISTVCYPSSGGFQCICEDQYRWSCDQCLTYGSCDNITDDTCGCIEAVPPDGQYCQPVDQYNFTACPPTTTITTTSAPPPTNSTSDAPDLNTTIVTPTPTTVTNSTPDATTDGNTTTVAPTPATVTNSTDLNNTTATPPTPIVINSSTVTTTDINTTATTIISTNSTHFTTTDMNTTTAVTNSTTGVNTTMFTTTPTTAVTNSTPDATTDMNSTTAATPTIIVTNSTTATTDMNTTTFTTIPTIITNSTEFVTEVNTTTTATPTTAVTNSTPVATTNVNTTLSSTPTSTVTNSTTVTTMIVNTTTLNTTPTDVTNSTPAPNMTSTTAITPTTITNSSTVGTSVNTAVSTTPPTAGTDTTPHPNITTTIVSSTSAVTSTDVTSQNTTISSTTSEAPTSSHSTTTTTANTTISTTTTATTTNATVPTTVTTATTTPTAITAATTTATTTPTATTVATTTATTTPTATTVATTTTTTTPTATTVATTTATTTPTASTVLDVEMSFRFNKQYTPELNDATSTEYKDLESRVILEIVDLYGGITGYTGAFIKGFREGSIITDFVVQTTQVNPDEIASANRKLPDALGSIAPVIGPVSAFYISPTLISIPELTYTGNTMTLKCGPPVEIDVGQISSSAWTFNGREIKNTRRMEITLSEYESVLNINNVIPADSGLYSCTLKGRTVDFQQKGIVTDANIRQAPNLKLQSEVNVRCEDTKLQPLRCCVQRPFTVNWFQDSKPLNSVSFNDGEDNCIQHDYDLGGCSGSQDNILQFTCRVDDPSNYQMTTTMTIFRADEDIRCNDDQYGVGRAGDRSSIECPKGQEGLKTAVCQETGEWILERNTCIVTEIKELLIDSEDLVVEEVPQFVANLSKAVQQSQTQIANSSATISAVVNIINTVATVSTTVNETVMQNVLSTVDAIIGDDARESWVVLNANESSNASSNLLGSLETLSNDLVGEFNISTPRILLIRTTFNNSFRSDLNSSIVIDIPNTDMSNISITTITLSSLNNVMPTRNSTFDVSLFNATSNETVSDNAINAAVLLVKVNATIQNVTLSYNKLNNSLTLDPQCVFWNFTLFNNLGAWDDEGCKFVSDINNTVTCRCNHLTSFSILMATNIPPFLREALDIITYVGVGISIASLVICLIIEGYVWKAITRNSTAFMRHVSIINTALSLLIADICFIIGASIAKNPIENPGENYEVPLGPCSTATFFMHFFYLALFFWMLVSGLLLFYRTVMVFSHMSKSTMLAIGFCLGYGCPLIIAVITVAVTAPGNGYIRRNEACWLNWIDTKALLAMVIPALTIVFINIIIVIVVLFKMLRRGIGNTAQTDEKHTLVVITRCVIILTPLFGLTWSLGVGTMVSSTNRGIHIAFAFFNSLQGFFILVFGTLLDSKIRSLLSRRSPTTSSGTGSNSTRSTSGGISSLSGTNLISRLLGRRYIYHVSQAASSNSSGGASESFVHI